MTVVEVDAFSSTSDPADVRVLVVDDHRVLRESLSHSLSALGIAVVATAATGHEALELAAQSSPQAVLLDVSLPDLDGVAVLRRLRAEYPATAVVMLSMYADAATRRDALSAGAAAYLTKDTSTADIADTVRLVASSDAIHGSERAAPASRPDDDQYSLSRREVEVLQLIAEGKSTQTVARELFISVKTVKNHLANIYAKLDVGDRTQAVVQGLRMGLVHLR